MRDGAAASTPHTLIFEPFTLDLARSTLLRDGQVLPLRRQSYDVLRYLVEAGGRVVSNTELVDAVWSTRPAQPQDSVTQCIKDIRRAMGDDARWMIRTVSGKGYEFKATVYAEASGERSVVQAANPETGETLLTEHAAEVDPVSPTSLPTGRAAQILARLGSFDLRERIAAAALGLVILAVAGVFLTRSLWPTGAPATLEMLARPTVAILPLAASPDLAGAEHAEVIASELQTAPRGFDILIKTMPTSLGRGAALPKSLGARYIVDGTLGQDGGRSRITIRLVEAETARQIWAGPFDYATDEREARQLVAARIARELAVQIRTAENARPLPARVEAGHRVIQARVLFEAQRGEEITKRAKGLYDQAVALDGDNVQALMGYTRTRLDILLNGWCSPQERITLLDEADQAIEHALKIDARSPGAHLLRGVVARGRGNHERAVASFEYVIELNPTYVHGHAELARSKIDVGRANESIAHIEHAFALSPRDPVAARWAFWAGMAAAHVGDYELTKKWMLQAHQMDGHYKRPLSWLGIAYAQTGEIERAHATLREYCASYPDFSVATWSALLNRGNATVAAQHERLKAVLRNLDVAETPSPAGARCEATRRLHGMQGSK